MSPDNEYVRLLSWAAHEFMRRSRLSSTRYSLTQVIEALPPPQVSPTVMETSAPLPPGAGHYEAPVAIARELARSRSVMAPDENHGRLGQRRQVASLLIDMAVLFEGLVSALYSAIARERSWRHSVQAKTVFAVRQGSGEGANKRHLLPDDVIEARVRDRLLLVSDSKYHGRAAVDNEGDADSRLGPAVFYQLTSSMLARNAKCGLLVQPRIESLPPETPNLEEWRVNSSLLEESLRVVLVRLDLRSIEEDQGFERLRDQLATGLDAALELAD